MHCKTMKTLHLGIFPWSTQLFLQMSCSYGTLVLVFVVVCVVALLVVVPVHVLIDNHAYNTMYTAYRQTLIKTLHIYRQTNGQAKIQVDIAV